MGMNEGKIYGRVAPGSREGKRCYGSTKKKIIN